MKKNNKGTREKRDGEKKKGKTRSAIKGSK